MKTFFFKGKELKAFDTVYEPSDDSFLLAENTFVKKGTSALDMGTGTGIQGINAAMQGAGKIVCIDVNQKALENAEENAKKLALLEKFEFRKGSLFKAIKKGEKFDTIIFNPPYVATEEKKFCDLDGGEKGRDTLDLFLEKFPRHLKEKGNCFFLQTDINGEEKTMKKLEKQGFEAERIAGKRIFFEKLVVFRAKKKLL